MSKELELLKESFQYVHDRLYVLIYSYLQKYLPTLYVLINLVKFNVRIINTNSLVSNCIFVYLYILLLLYFNIFFIVLLEL